MKTNEAVITAKSLWKLTGLLAIFSMLGACASAAVNPDSPEGSVDDSNVSPESQAQIETRRECKRRVRNTGSRLSRDDCGSSTSMFGSGFHSSKEYSADAAGELPIP